MPTSQSEAPSRLAARFDRIFQRRTGFATLARLHANKAELLMVLDRPEIPLNTNGSENDIRCQVTKRKISGGTTQRYRPRLPRCLPVAAQDMRQARRLVLGLSR
ncbi:transposase [Rhizobium sp. RHZ02]|uniref:IS66 family transposase n=1 Tax=Rhizobium sp. RHZ02 TaxID=2769306 RepID=UPI001FED96DE|nr:transposase [Rhizobium sp. RHZ02]